MVVQLTPEVLRTDITGTIADRIRTLIIITKAGLDNPVLKSFISTSKFPWQSLKFCNRNNNPGGTYAIFHAQLDEAGTH
jgi:hypothetical protein